LIAVLMVLGLGAVTLFLPSLGLRFATLAAFLLAIRRIAPSMVNINQASVALSRYQRELEMIEQVTQQLSQEPRGGLPIDRIEQIELAQVSFSYPSRPEHAVLHHIDAMMRRGTMTAIVGATGAGKSTIASLLLRLYDVPSGSIRINDTDLRALDVVGWRRRLGYVSQDLFVFNTTIRDNIMLGASDIAPAQVEWAARVAQLHEFILSLPEGYETIVGDRGLRLSGGQCQRLAIARAIVHRPNVLVFDEATSALDNLTERAVYDAIRTLRDEAIVIVIAHRLRTIQDANHILVLDAGRVVEQGTHGELLTRRGLYSRLYEENSQALNSESEPSVALT